MAQTTLDRVTDRVRELADRTGEVTNQALGAVLPDRRASRPTMRRWQSRTTRRIGFNLGARASKAAPAAMKTAWKAGEFTGRMEGIASAIPNMTRLWMDRSIAQARGKASSGGVMAAWRGTPKGTAGMRLISRTGQRVTDRMGAARDMMSDQASSWLKRTAGMAAVTGGVAALRSRFRSNTVAMAQPLRRAGKIRRPRSTFARRAPSAGKLQGTQRTLRSSWRWVRYFTMGFALGAIWAYLFAPRHHGDEQHKDQTTTQTSASGQQHTTTHS